MKHIVVEGDLKVGKEGDILVTRELGTGLGLMAYDPVAKVGGLLHAMLPLSKSDPKKAKENPCLFVDTGVPKLFDEIGKIGGQKGRLIVKAAGCAHTQDENEMYKIGERNFSVLNKLLWKNNIILESEDVGGREKRIVQFDLATGEITVNS